VPRPQKLWSVRHESITRAGVSETAFLGRLQELLALEVAGMDPDRKAEVLRAAAGALDSGGEPLQCRIVPFVPGRRPHAEALHPGLGSSEEVAVLMPGAHEDPVWLLYALKGGSAANTEVRARVAFTGPDGSMAPVPVPGWEDRAVSALTFVVTPEGSAAVGPADGAARRRVLALSPARDLLPGTNWEWEELGAGIREGATDHRDAFTFGHLFSQQLRVELQALNDGVPVAGTEASLLVCDLRRCGSLYKRLLDRLVGPDAERQAAEAGVENLGAAYHPWFPVLVIGADKAALYTRALVQDIAGAGQHLSDPGWLVRVGLYLEFLTFLGICEAVKDDVGDLLSPAERAAFEGSGWFADIRSCIDPAAWRKVWELHRIQFARRGTPRTGPVSASNLLAKRKATLHFLHVHHDDLKHAIRLAGRNHHNAQETWQRVFRDAERAVLRNAAAAFPELESVSGSMRDFILWHRKGRFELGRAIRLPGVVSSLLADQDGLFGSACDQYRESMNDVADWAKQRDLMDHTGLDCVPRQVSLLEAHVNQPARVELLQHSDGYGPDLEVGAELPSSYQHPAADIEALIAAVPIFTLLEPSERQALSRAARPLTLGPTERLIVQGQEGGSLFVVAEGEVEVVLRGEDGSDRVVDTMGKGAVVGEMSLLTGARRNATVRAVEGAVVYEIGSEQFGPVLGDHPELVDVLTELMGARLAERRERLDALDAEWEPRAFARRIRKALLPT
jgi:CRP-like cAMP-binding protein